MKGWQYVRTGIYWCARAFDKGAKGGKVFGVDIDDWREGGKAGLGWNIKLTTPVAAEESEAGSSDGEATGSEASLGEEGSETGSEGENELDEPEGGAKRKRRVRTEGSTRVKSAKRAKLAQKPMRRPAVKGKIKKLPHPKSSSSFLPLSVPSLEDLPTDPYERALRLLHVGATPESLPCREEEFVDVLSRVEEGVETGGGGCLCRLLLEDAYSNWCLFADIAGVPGTGKTATVHAVVKELKRKAEDGVSWLTQLSWHSL